MAERRPHQHHGGHACLRADQAGRAEHRVADQPADGNRDQRVAQGERRHEERPRDEHQQADAEASPERGRVEEAEHAQALGHGLDAPRRRLRIDCHPTPFAGITRIRFSGVISAPRVRSTPVSAL